MQIKSIINSSSSTAKGHNRTVYDPLRPTKNGSYSTPTVSALPSPPAATGSGIQPAWPENYNHHHIQTYRQHQSTTFGSTGCPSPSSSTMSPNSPPGSGSTALAPSESTPLSPSDAAKTHIDPHQPAPCYPIGDVNPNGHVVVWGNSHAPRTGHVKTIDESKFSGSPTTLNGLNSQIHQNGQNYPNSQPHPRIVAGSPTVAALPPLKSIPEGTTISEDSPSDGAAAPASRAQRRPQAIQVVHDAEFREMRNAYHRFSTRSSITPQTATTPSVAVWGRMPLTAGGGPASGNPGSSASHFGGAGGAAAALVDLAMGLPSPQYLYIGQIGSPTYLQSMPAGPSLPQPNSARLPPPTPSYVPSHAPPTSATATNPLTNSSSFSSIASPSSIPTSAPSAQSPSQSHPRPPPLLRAVPPPIKTWADKSQQLPVPTSATSNSTISASGTPTSNLPVYTHLYGAQLPPILSERAPGTSSATTSPTGSFSHLHYGQPGSNTQLHGSPTNVHAHPTPHSSHVQPLAAPKNTHPAVSPNGQLPPPSTMYQLNEPTIDSANPQHLAKQDENPHVFQLKIPRRGPFRPPLPVTVSGDSIVVDYETPKNLCSDPNLLELYKNTKGPRPSQGLLDRLHSDKELWKKANKIKKGYFSCVHCGMRFATLAKYAEHIEVYSVERPYLCSEENCPWSIVGFYKKTELSRHEKSQHGYAIYACTEPHCDRIFTRKDSLKRHLGFVHAGPPRPWSKRNKVWKNETSMA